MEVRPKTATGRRKRKKTTRIATAKLFVLHVNTLISTIFLPKTFVASFVLLSGTNPRQLFNELVFLRIILHEIHN